MKNAFLSFSVDMIIPFLDKCFLKQVILMSF